MYLWNNVNQLTWLESLIRTPQKNKEHCWIKWFKIIMLKLFIEVGSFWFMLTCGFDLPKSNKHLQATLPTLMLLSSCFFHVDPCADYITFLILGISLQAQHVLMSKSNHGLTVAMHTVRGSWQLSRYFGNFLRH